MICRYVLSGSGGQGVITAGLILGEATVMYENLNALQSQVYGPEARGGAARTDVIISSEEIHYPKIINPDILACLSQESFDRYISTVRPGGMVVYDSHNVRRSSNADARMVGLDFYSLCTEKFGSTQMINICLLGALAGLTDIVKIESMQNVIEKRFDRNKITANMEALNLGFDLVSLNYDKKRIVSENKTL